ncbi:MAG: glycosyltransferase family 9 protein [Alphaproteobacteria bacterium]
MSAPAPRVLVIKLGALGDFVQAMGPFAAIRAHHPDAHITLLTTSPYATFAQDSPWFDRVWIDSRPKLWQIGALLELRHWLREGRFDRVYDLQTSDRSSWYYRLFFPGLPPQWSGIARGCSHPHDNPHRDFLHTVERQAEQLAMAGIASVALPDLSWCGSGKLPGPIRGSESSDPLRSITTQAHTAGAAARSLITTIWSSGSSCSPTFAPRTDRKNVGRRNVMSSLRTG